MNVLSFSAAMSLILAVLTISACGPGAAPASERAAPPAPAKVSSPGQESWQQEWTRLQEAARKEGKIVIASMIAQSARQAISEALQDKFGIEPEFISGRPAEFAPKILAERRAGLYLEDMMIGGAETGLAVLKPAGALEPLDPVIFLPEVLDPKAWHSGSLIWNDKDHHVISFAARPTAPIVINTEMVKREEIKSYRDLLNLKWKGKILIGDPTVGGGGNGLFSALAEGVMSLDYLRELARQDPMIAKDERLLGEWVARGKYPIAMAIGTETQTEFMRTGAPIDVVTPAEGTYVSAGTGVALMLKNAPHPNAAKVVVNWLLTKEGGTVFARATGGQSGRVDVPTDFLHPAMVRQPGIKYLDTSSEEYIARKNEYLKTAREIFAASLK
ncbi:MAG: extracellular solute-binding protein [Chloroflexi bacterium]|nr:extracellular solute-binding protein [Chloroflexota bacterium]